ncbi:MAG: rRNA pseudouridine synthase [Defluviitaleaceae bacterium]|nr:rRNA pseudouridine synthase [Defluviitaleaceae bacterium]
MRLQKYLAEAGVASRRKAEEIITAGRVTINGQVAAIGNSVSENDVILMDGEAVSLKQMPMYVILNKPAGVVSTAKDQFGRASVLDLVKGVDARLYPVGRLDFHSMGLVLLTNDGDLAYKLTHPKHHIPKTYVARVAHPIKPEDLVDFQKGIYIDGYKTRPAQIELIDKTGRLAKITLFEGRNRQIRKMFASQQNEVVSLKRVAMGDITLGDLVSGAWRHLTKEEAAYLRGELL